MFSMTLLAVGKLKEPFYQAAVAEYAKRLQNYCHFQLIELSEQRLPDNPNPTEIAAALEKEATVIRSHIPKGAWFCVFTPEGQMQSSEQFAQMLHEVKLRGKSCACFLIGSSFGMAPSLKQQADCRLSFSKMTFPHHLARVMVAEQLYRAEAIQAGSRYHK